MEARVAIMGEIRLVIVVGVVAPVVAIVGVVVVVVLGTLIVGDLMLGTFDFRAFCCAPL